MKGTFSGLSKSPLMNELDTKQTLKAALGKCVLPKKAQPFDVYTEIIANKTMSSERTWGSGSLGGGSSSFLFQLLQENPLNLRDVG